MVVSERESRWLDPQCANSLGAVAGLCGLRSRRRHGPMATLKFGVRLGCWHSGIGFAGLTARQIARMIAFLDPIWCADDARIHDRARAEFQSRGFEMLAHGYEQLSSQAPMFQ